MQFMFVQIQKKMQKLTEMLHLLKNIKTINNITLDVLTI